MAQYSVNTIIPTFANSKSQSRSNRKEELNESILLMSAFQTIKRVTGRLTRLLHFKNKSADPVRRMLVVEDEQAICFSISEYFTHQGFEVETASEIEQAESLIRDSTYEVIIQDLRLDINKNIAGLEIIRFVQHHSPDTKVIVLTAYGSEEVEKEARQSGAAAFLRKPQRLSQVALVVNGLTDSLPRQSVH